MSVHPGFFPRNRRGGVLFRFYTGSVLTFVSFCCKPSAISPSAARIARSRRGEAIRGVGPPKGVGWKIRKLLLRKEMAPRNPPHNRVGDFADLRRRSFSRFQAQHRAKRTFGTSRRDLAISVAGTPSCRLRPTTPRARPAFPLLKLNLPGRTGKKYHTSYRLEMHPACGTAAGEVTFPQPLGISGYRTLSI